jgi:ABC-2 type transport system permease protein
MGTNQETSTSPIQETPFLWNPVNKLLDNPIIARELKGRMRGKQGFILLTAYLALISLVIAGVYLYSVNDGNVLRSDSYALQEIGKLIFNTVVMLEFLLVALIGPALTSGAISSERERGTFDLLRTTLLSSRALVFGKLGAAIAYLLLLIFAALPLQSLAFFLGGVGMGEMIISLAMLTTSTLLFCTVGIYFSGIARKTSISNAFAYGSMLIPIAVGGILYFLVDNNSLDLSSASIEAQVIMVVFIWMLLSTNPFTAALVSEIVLEEEQSLFKFTLSSSNISLTVFSPWIYYTVFSVTLTLLMIWLTVFYLNRYER